MKTKITLMQFMLLSLLSLNVFAQDFPVTVLKGHTEAISSIAFSPDGQTLASGSLDDTIRLWDVNTGKHLRTLAEHWDNVTSVAFSPDGQTLASGSEDRTIKLWDANTGNLRRTFKGHTHAVSSIAFSPDEQTLVSGSHDRTIKLWGTYSGRVRHTFQGHEDIILSVAFSPSGRTLASGSEDQTVRLWHTQSGALLSTFIGHASRVNSVAFSFEGKVLASGSLDGTVRVWDARIAGPLHTFKGEAKEIRSVVFRPAEQILVEEEEEEHIVILPDEETFASGNTYRTGQLWNAKMGGLLTILEGHRNTVQSVAFDPKGEMLATGGHDNTIRVWKLGTALRPQSHARYRENQIQRTVKRSETVPQRIETQRTVQRTVKSGETVPQRVEPETHPVPHRPKPIRWKKDEAEWVPIPEKGGETTPQPVESEPEAVSHGPRPILWKKDGAEMVLIPEGEFQMGTPNRKNEPAAPYAVHTNGFYIDTHEVTLAQYEEFLKRTGHRPLPEQTYTHAPAPNYPVVNVTWDDAVAYAAWAGKRLPTEAEWEKAARGGFVSQKYPWGNAPSDGTQSNLGGPEDNHKASAPVGSYLPNEFGLYDMLGNVWEWCSDTTDPQNRVLRGNSWRELPRFAYLTERYLIPYQRQHLVGGSIGFRCVVDVDKVP